MLLYVIFSRYIHIVVILKINLKGWFPLKITKTDFVAHVAKEMDMPKAVATKALDAVMAVIGEQLMAGNDVALPEIGTFSLSVRPEKEGHNPRNGETMIVPQATVLKFKVSKNLKKMIADVKINE